MLFDNSTSAKLRTLTSQWTWKTEMEFVIYIHNLVTDDNMLTSWT